MAFFKRKKIFQRSQWLFYALLGSVHQTHQVVFLLFDGHLTTIFDATTYPNFWFYPYLLLSNNFNGSSYCIVGHTVDSTALSMWLSSLEHCVWRLCMTTRNQTKYLRVLSHNWAEFCKWVKFDITLKLGYLRRWVGCGYFSRVRFDSSVPCWVRRAQVLLLYFSASVQHVQSQTAVTAYFLK